MIETIWNRLRGDETGATAVEYGLIAVLIAIAAAGVMLSLGGEVESQYEGVSSEYADANTGVPGRSAD